MASYNKVFLMGNLTRDPELRNLPSGSHVCEVGMATNRKYKTPDGQDREEVCFIDLVLYGRQAEIMAQYKKKGDPIFAEGRLKLDTWESNDGQKRSKHRVVVENFQFLGKKGEGGGGRDSSMSYGAPAPAAAAATYSSSGGSSGGDFEPPAFGDEDVPF